MGRERIGGAMLVLMAAASCGPKVPVVDAGDSSTSTTTTSTSASAGPVTSATNAVTTFDDGGDVDGSADDGGVGDEGGITGFFPDFGMPPANPCSNPDHDCPTTIGCNNPVVCGPPQIPIDEQGCLRRSCTSSAECAPDEACFRPADYGGCAPSGLSCSLSEFGECICGGESDCDGAYCVRWDLLPPIDCNDITDYRQCQDPACWLIPGARMVIVDDECTCGIAEQCTWIPPEGPDVGPLDGPIYRPGVPGVFFPGDGFTSIPWGWVECGNGMFPDPPECSACDPSTVVCSFP